MAPFLACGFLVVTALTGTTWLSLDSRTAGAGTLIGAGLLILSIVATAAVLLVHAPWGRRVGLAVAAGYLVSTATVDPGWANVLVGVLALATLGALSGPWLNSWIRQLPPPDGVGPRPMALALGLVGFPIVAGVGALGGTEPAHVITGIAIPLIGWGYATGHSWGLWLARIAAPSLAVWTAAASSMPWSIAVIAATVALVAIAWTPQAARAIRPLYVSPPGPRHGTPLTTSDPS